MRQRRWIGIGGSIASGKSTLSDFFRQQGYRVIDADQVARQVVLPGTAGHKALKLAFPEAFLGEELDRKKLGQIIFDDDAKRTQLNELLHPLIVEESRAQLEAEDGLVFFEAPLLFDSVMLPEFDLTIYVTASREIQLKRLMQRDHISRQYAEQKLAAFKEPAVLPSIIVKNNRSLEDFAAQSESLLAKIIA